MASKDTLLKGTKVTCLTQRPPRRVSKGPFAESTAGRDFSSNGEANGNEHQRGNEDWRSAKGSGIRDPAVLLGV